jgi:hypothetical protein
MTDITASTFLIRRSVHGHLWTLMSPVALALVAGALDDMVGHPRNSGRGCGGPLPDLAQASEHRVPRQPPGLGPPSALAAGCLCLSGPNHCTVFSSGQPQPDPRRGSVMSPCDDIQGLLRRMSYPIPPGHL